MTEQLTDPAILRKIPIFDDLSDQELKRILEAEENGIEEYGMKTTVVKESEIGRYMYVILDGAVEVSIRGMGGSGRELPIATLRSGDFFGEQALTSFDSTARYKSTVRTIHGAKLFRIDKKYVQLALSGDVEDSEDITVPRSTAEHMEMQNLIKGMRLFQTLKGSELESLGVWTEIIEVEPGDFVIKESEKGDSLFVVLSGQVEIFTLDDNGKVIILARRKRGEYFGEQSLMPGSDGKRNAYARAHDKAKLIKIPKAYFRLILKRDSELASALEKTGSAQKKLKSKFHKK